jgi:hypothetical protein
MKRAVLEEYQAELYWIKSRIEASNPTGKSPSGVKTLAALDAAINGMDGMLDGHKPKKATK